MPKDSHHHAEVPGFTPATLAVRDEFRDDVAPIATMVLGDRTVDIRPGRDTLWVIVRRKGHGAIALRTIPWAGPYKIGKTRRRGSSLMWDIGTTSGVWTITLTRLDDQLMRLTISLKPSADVLLTFWPRDLYPLDNKGDPTQASGCVEAAQRGVNAGYCYFSMARPAFGNILYMQNLTALNPYFLATKTKPDGVVGGEWPELGYQPPTAPMGNSPPVNPLKAGTEVVISDALLALRTGDASDEKASARQFLDMLADIYPYLDKPEPLFHDWAERAKRTAHDLKTAPDARVEAYGHVYLHPYVGAEYPDSMVQMTVLASLHEFERAFDIEPDLSTELAAGIGKFYDKDLSAIRRYLPNVGDDKNADAVDSWYLYHPLMNLARLAQAGNAKAEKLFRDSLGFAVKAAHHFDYVWPIQFDVTTFKVITKSRSPQGRGQTDVGGLYAYVMLQAHELTGDDAYLDEARAALKALEGTRFNLAYQTNLTAWGAVACLKLWRLDKKAAWLDQSFVFAANFLHNCELWDSELGTAQHYTNFFGLTCLHDAPYMAAYECFECFAACDEYLMLGGKDLPHSVRLLLCEYRRYALDFTWYFYPDALPQDAIASDNIRNGHIDRALSFPLEDLYGDGQPAGQVGQEVYGCGGAFVFAARAFHDCGDAPFRLFADYPVRIEPGKDGAFVIDMLGSEGLEVRLRIVKKGRKTLPGISLRLADKDTPVALRHRGKDFRDYRVPGNARLSLKWK